MRPSSSSGWPDGRRFAFTIVDDTDGATRENVEFVYEFLLDLGVRITKTVWPLAPEERSRHGGQTLEDASYRDWILGLRDRGVEIASHGASDHPSSRERTRRALDYFYEVVGHHPRLHANHTGQLECMYWGEDRLDGTARLVYKLANRLRRTKSSYFGHVEDSAYFWGDICRERIRYVRNFSFPDVNTISRDPLMPYHDPRRPFVNYWFSASDGAVCGKLCTLLSEENQERLLAEQGACIVYSHLAHGFYDGRTLNSRFVDLMKRLANQAGWFVPASTILDHLLCRRDSTAATDRFRLKRMQYAWLFRKLLQGSS
jgi:hypothetical protein